MFGALLRIVLIVVIVAAVAAFFIGYRIATPDNDGRTVEVVGTTGETVDAGEVREDIRETGADIAEQLSVGASRAQHMAADGALTAKIKSKMALDDTITATTIDVDTTDRQVTLSGWVESEAQRARAVQLARETDGVATVVDRLSIR